VENLGQIHKVGRLDCWPSLHWSWPGFHPLVAKRLAASRNANIPQRNVFIFQLSDRDLLNKRQLAVHTIWLGTKVQQDLDAQGVLRPCHKGSSNNSAHGLSCLPLVLNQTFVCVSQRQALVFKGQLGCATGWFQLQEGLGGRVRSTL
jgi:hypothetical protein